jgi:N-acetylglucosaminyldiphosphoundecaprenol N-acetyl-beta-D-mannosaminyltransferase
MFTSILKYNIFNGTKDELLGYIKDFEKVNIISGNPEVLYNGIKNPKLFRFFTGEHSVIIPDGVGTVLASKFVGRPVSCKIAGIDLMKDIISRCEKERKPVYFVGAKQDVLDKCIMNLKKNYKNLNVAGSHNGYFDLENCDDIIDDIIEKKPYAIFVAMGSPKQDVFISTNMDRFPCSIFMGVGGSFDVFAGETKRAPKWMIKVGLEWLYRVIKEPWRIKRLASIPRFLFKVMEYESRN